MCDYKNGKIYQIVCNITGETYIGSTCNSLEHRLATHKNDNCRSKQIIERGDYYIELLETYPCNNEFELNRKEGEYQRLIKCVNCCIAGRTKKEYYEDNKDVILKKHRKYRADTNDAIGVRYYKKHSLEIRQKSHNYYHDNKETISLKTKQKITCECGCEVRKTDIARHKRSKKHIDLMNKITSPSNDLLVEEKVL